MSSNQRSNQYDSSNADKMNNNNSKLLEELWTRYSAKGPSFGYRDFEHIFSALKNNGMSDKDVDSLKVLFNKELEQVKKYSTKYARKIMDQVGRANLTDSQVFEYVNQQCKKHQFSRPVCDAIFREVSYQLNQLPNRSNYFRYTPTRNTSLGKTLGFSNYENYSKADVSDADKTIINDIMRLHSANELTQDAIIKQTLSYDDCSLTAVTGSYNPEKHKPEINVHPVLAALFIPKIRVLENVMLLSCISNIVKCRVTNSPIMTRPDYELFYNICTDKNEFVCDNKNLWNDLKMRALIQVAVWKNVLALRSGRYYEESTILPFMNELQTCNFYKYEAPDLLRSTDEPGSIIRRLLYTFSFKPVFVQTLPMGPMAGLTTNLASTNAYVTPQLFNGELDTLPMVNMRLNSASTNNVVSLSDVLNDYEVYFDTSNGMYVPKMTKVVNARGVLIVYVHRLNYAIELTKQGPFHFEKLPNISGLNYRLNTSVVQTNETLSIEDAEFTLRSVVALKTTRISDKENRENDLIIGCEALIHPELRENSPYTVDEYLVYDPENVGKYLNQTNNLVNNAPFTTAKWDDIPERNVQLKIATKGVVYIFSANEEENQ